MNQSEEWHVDHGIKMIETEYQPEKMGSVITIIYPIGLN
jgi:hypothetical protein